MTHKQNLHTHTSYVDGKNTVEEMIIQAIKSGFNSIGFSEHSYLCYSSFPNQLTLDNMILYKNEISNLKFTYQDKIDIFCGLECDFYSNVDMEGFDYLIGSVHYLDCNGSIVGFDRGVEETLDYISKYFNGNGLSFAKKYYETVSLLPVKYPFDIVGHFDLVIKNNVAGRFVDTSSKEYLDMGFEAIHALKGKIHFFEVNTGAIARGYKTEPYPQMEFLKEFNRLGFGAVITSDCHDKHYIDCHFKEAEELLSSTGFKTKWILTDNGFVEIGL